MCEEFLMKVLVTGATGFTGGHLARELKRRGHAVLALARPSADARSLIEHGIEVVSGDIANRDEVIAATRGIDAVYHTAAAYREAKHPDEHYWKVNVGGTVNVIEACSRHGVRRLVHCSTGGVHGHIHNIPAVETTPFNPGDVYQRTKLEGELHVQQAIRTGMPATIVRPSAIYGPGDMRLLKLFRALQRGTFRVFGDGRTRYHLVHISDLVEGMILCGTHERAIGQTYILAGPRFMSIQEMVRLIAEAVGVRPPRGHLPLWPLLVAAVGCEAVCRVLRIEPPLHRRRADFFRKDRGFSSRKAQGELGYQPRIQPEQGIRETAEWYFAHGHLARPQPRSVSMAEGRA
jgi:dihydroflavonol-4-reductase